MPHGIEGLPPIFARLLLDRSLVPDFQDQLREPLIADAVKETHISQRFGRCLGLRVISTKRIFPNAEACLRLIRALAAETDEDWLEASRYLNMEALKEQKKQQLRMAA
jgi:transposase-like protein